MKSLFRGMSQKCSNLDSNVDPLTAEGIPDKVYQRMFGDCDTIAITIDLLTLLLAPRTAEDGTPNPGAQCAVPSELITEGLFADASERMDPNREDPRSDMHSAVLLAFRFLKQAIKNNSDNATTLASFQGFIAANLGGPFKVVDTYGELFRSEPRLLHSVTDANVMEIVKCLKNAQQVSGEGARFVDLLLTLCSAGGISFPSNQVRIRIRIRI